MKAEDVFLAALEKAIPADRKAYLDEACRDNAELRSQVEGLLQSHEEAGSFLQHPVVDPQPTLTLARITEKPGTVIGRYKLLEQIGEGGFGVVFMAEQEEPVRRKVALKIIKPGMDTKEVIARFEAERQALAIMDHPNIAKVLDAGATESGRPYFVMELVRGIPITEFCDQNSLPTRDRLELFSAVCQAVQHAHQKGIIHRDIKPSNVLVTMHDDKPVPKVIDFGVAKAMHSRLTERTLFTRFAQMVGTPLYMSPEQAQMSGLDIDTRSDIYSLGVLLYELLTGSTPFDRQRFREAAYDEMLRIIREEEPPRPSLRISTLGDTLPSVAAHRKTEPKKLSAVVRGELDWIVMKALEKDRTRRYESASGFAHDIERYLADEPVLACPPSVAYRFKKFARRNRAGLLVAGLILLFLVGLGSVFGWAIRDHEAREELAQQERAARHKAVHEAAEQALDESTRLLPKGIYPQALAEARRAETALAALSGGSEDETDGELRSRIAEQIRDLQLVLRMEDIRLECSTVVNTEQGPHFDYAGTDRKYAEAFRQYGIDVETLETATAAEQIGRRAVAVELALALDHWADCRRRIAAASDANWRRLVDVAKSVDPEPVRCRLRSLWGARVTRETREEVASLAASERLRTLKPITITLVANALSKSETPERALEYLEHALREHPDEFWLHFDASSEAGSCRPRRSDDSILHLKAALALRPWSSAVLTNLAARLNDVERFEEAADCSRRAIALAPDNSFAYCNLGTAMEGLRGSAEAIAYYRRAVELAPRFPEHHLHLGNALKVLRQHDAAVASCRKAVELSPQYAASYNGLGNALSAQGNKEEACASFRKAIHLDPLYAPAYYNLGIALNSQGKPVEAAAAYRKAIELAPNLSRAHCNLGAILYAGGKRHEAIACYRKAVETDPKNAHAHDNLGQALAEQGKHAEALACFRKALELDPKLSLAHFNLGKSFGDQGKQAEALACYRKALELDPKLAAAHNNLGMIFKDQGKLDEAIACFRNAFELDPRLSKARGNLVNALEAQGNREELLATLRKILEHEPNSASVHNLVAWFLAMTEDVKFRNYGEALTLARRAVHLDPKPWRYWDTLSVAAYRAGDWKTALAARKEAVQRRAIRAEDRLYLAMIHWQLGDKPEARKCYDEAAADILKQANNRWSELQREAQELLGVAVPPGSPPGNKPQPQKNKP